MELRPRSCIRRLAAATASLVLAAASGTLSPAGAHPASHEPGAPSGITPETRGLLRDVRQATSAFRDVAAARAAGYEATGACAEDPKYGGMGIHYANPALIEDGVLDPLKPEILVYQPMGYGRLRLGAVEYVHVDADGDLATSDDLPSMFDVPFDGPMLGHEPGMPVHDDLHVWLDRHNPAGLFAAWNPTVDCPTPEVVPS